jgi:hypothetical protein
MANILKRNSNDESGQANGSSFTDKTTENWYCKKGANKVIFCKSIDDILEGNTESFDYVKKETSVRKEQNAKGGYVERKKYILFTLGNNDKIIVRIRDELK